MNDVQNTDEDEFKRVYPEHEKLKAVVDQSQPIGEFMDWLFNEKNYMLCTFVEGRNHPVLAGIRAEDLISEYFDIDPQKIEDEKRAMFLELRLDSMKKTTISAPTFHGNHN